VFLHVGMLSVLLFRVAGLLALTQYLAVGHSRNKMVKAGTAFSGPSGILQCRIQQLASS